MVWEFTLLFVALLIGIAAGVCVERRHRKAEKVYGVLNIDCSDPSDGAYLYLQLTVPIAEVADRKQVTFNVNVISDVSQK